MSNSNIAALIEAYDHLSTFPDVNPALIRLSADASIQPVVFSNGSKTMVSNSVLRSKDLASNAGVFQDLITVDEIQRYKPSPASYHHLARKMGKQESQMEQLWLISGNPFDIVGARSVGMQAIWVDRTNRGWQDAVAPGLRPSAIVHSLEQIIQEIQSRK